MKSICKIKVIKNGRFFITKVFLAEGRVKEYRHPVFEDVLTEMAVDLQDILEDIN
jgi:hypothetical protein